MTTGHTVRRSIYRTINGKLCTFKDKLVYNYVLVWYCYLHKPQYFVMALHTTIV
jgi:hypothetical protein